MKTGGYGCGLWRRCNTPDPRQQWPLAPVHFKPEGWLSRLPYALLLLPWAPIALAVAKSSRKTSFIQALGFGSCGSKFRQYGHLYIGVLALSQRGFVREAVLILHSGSDMLRLGLIRRGWTPVWAARLHKTTRPRWIATRVVRRGKERSQVGPWGVSAHGHIPGLKPFLFYKLFSNLQITLNSTQIWILNDSFSQNKIKSEHSTIQKKNMHQHVCNNHNPSFD
jgi:hypothetical protein